MPVEEVGPATRDGHTGEQSTGYGAGIPVEVVGPQTLTVSVAGSAGGAADAAVVASASVMASASRVRGSVILT
jgi:hypothetical protein